MKGLDMKYNISVDHYQGQWRILNLQPGNDWQVSFGEYDDAYNFLLDLITRLGVN